MTYKNLKKHLLKNNISDSKTFFDLMPLCIKSKIILCIGEYACNTASFLSSVMKTSKIQHSHYVHSDDVELKDRFLSSISSAEVSDLALKAYNLFKRVKGTLSNDELLFLLALKLLDGKDEYLILEVPTDFYINSLSPLDLPIYALILCFFDDAKSQKCISLAPQSVKEIVALSQKHDYDYVSTSKNRNGTRVTYISNNKYNITRAGILCGTEFYYFSQLYFINVIDQNNVPLAALSIQSAKLLFGISYPMIAKGLGKAKLLYDLKLWSLSPTVLFYTGQPNFKLPLRSKAHIITNENEEYSKNDTVIFCGNDEFINRIKENIKNKC